VENLDRALGFLALMGVLGLALVGLKLAFVNP